MDRNQHLIEQSKTQSGPTTYSDDLAGRFIKTLIAWFPGAAIEQEYIQQALRMMEGREKQFFLNLHSIGKDALVEARRPPTIPALQKLIDRADVATSAQNRPVNLGLDSQVINHKAAGLLAGWFRKHALEARQIAARGYAAYLVDHLAKGAWRAAMVENGSLGLDDAVWHNLTEKWPAHPNPPAVPIWACGSRVPDDILEILK